MRTIKIYENIFDYNFERHNRQQHYLFTQNVRNSKKIALKNLTKLIFQHEFEMLAFN